MCIRDRSDHIGDNYYPNPGDELTFTATFKEDTSYNQYTEEYYVAASPSDYPVKTGEYAPGEISSELEFWYWNETTGEDRQLTPATFELDPDSTYPVSYTHLAKKTLRIVHQNIVFALGVKALVLLLGAAGMANMWEAVFADVGVSFIAILNAVSYTHLIPSEP